MKKSMVKFEAYGDVLNNVVKYLRCKDLQEIMPKLLNLLMERDIFLRISDKVRSVLDIEWAESPNELEKAIDLHLTERCLKSSFQN